MPHPGGPTVHFQRGSFSGLRPPPGFESEKYPLRHKLYYSFGLSAVTGTMNSTYITLVRNYKTLNAPQTIDVNPHHTNFKIETGAVCQPMSIVDRLRMDLRVQLTKLGDSDGIPLRCSWTPVFFSFPEKLDAADEETGTTVAAILNLLKDATEEDVTPLFNNTKLDITGTSEKPQPISLINMTEAFAILNMDTDLVAEAVSWDNSVFYDALQFYTNKGALKACIGRTRHMTLDHNHNHQTFRIDKFVPRAIRRIMPYAYFGILCHVPITADQDQYYDGAGLTASKAHIAFQANISYHEWNPDFNQDMVG